MMLDAADDSTINCFWDATTQGTQASNFARGVTTQGMRARQHHKEGDNGRGAMMQGR